MNILKQTEKFAKKMKWYDFSLIKASVFFFTLFLVTAWSGFAQVAASINAYVYLALFVIVTVPVAKKFFK